MVHHSSRIKLSVGQIFWCETGDNHHPVVIFLHGSWDDSSQWENTTDLLSKNFHCLALDLLGFGNSTAIQTPTSIENEADCLHEFLTALKFRQVYLVGHSLGAWIAISYTLKYPELIKGVVAISPEGFSLNNLQQYSLPTKLLLAHPWLFRLWLRGLQLITSVSDHANSLEKTQAYWDLFKKFPITCSLFFRRSIPAIRRELVADRLSQFRPPLLVLDYESDSPCIVKKSQANTKAVQKIEYKLIKKSEFTTTQESWLQVAREIQIFLDRVQLKIDREEVELC
jgi:pimeloyl-ACP methyl ester carboxylesterase